MTQTAHEKRDARSALPDGGRTSILVVDDVPDRLVAMQALLEDLGQNVVAVTSGREALRRLLEREFAVILLDVHMPDLDGFETASLIRSRARSEHIPIIFVTAFGDERHAFHGYTLGAVDYIPTPVVPEILRAKVRVFVELAQKNEQLRLQAAEQAALVELADRRAAQLRTMSAELARAEQRERRRLAQILHDHIQQLLVAATMRVDQARRQNSSHTSGQALGEVQDLLKQSIAASRSLATELSPPVLNEAGLAAALEWLARWMHEKHRLRVAVECEPELDPVPDELRLTLFQAVRELLFNVVKHSGTDAATIRLERLDDQWLCASVQDRGAGCDPAIAEERLGREGLGLFSIRERIEMLAGRLRIESSPGAGTCVRLSVPLGVAERPAVGGVASDIRFAPEPADARRRAAASDSNGDRGAMIHVLLVDDHAILRKGLKGLLEDQPDIEVVGEAADGGEAVALARTLAPDVVIMDINMPVMNGIEATRAIKREQPGLRIIGLSLHEDAEVIGSLIEAGASAYVTKGGPPDDLIYAIRAGASRDPALAAADAAAESF
ncbi:MAG: response regulator [Planctomycetes bacterium]|nr:response regulator [Planctomycetota bacterium]